jgi:hypothetical protein
MMFPRVFASAALAAILLASCQPGPQSGHAGSVALPAEHDPAVNWQDPCAANLTGVVEVLLLYYSQHHHLPATLEELPQKNLSGEPVSLVCPASHKRYEYFPDGFQAPSALIPSGMRLILYDVQPAHVLTQRVTDGTNDYDWKRPVRFGIVMLPPTSNRSLQMYVVPIEQGLLDVYLKSPQRQIIREIPTH